MGDFHIYATFIVIALTIAGYVSERFSIEAVSLASLAALLALFSLVPFADASGTVFKPEELIAGFANPALATVLALLIVGQGLFATDAMDRPARLAAKLGGHSGLRAMAITLVTAAALSAFLNNTPVVVIFIPVLTVLAAQRGFAASRALMPLSFLSILGGMTTLIGSSTNLLAAGVAERLGVTIGFFDFTIPALAVAGAGLLYVLFLMPRMLADRGGSQARARPAGGMQYIGEIAVGGGHPFLGVASRAGLFAGLKDLTPRLIVRRGLNFYPPFEDMVVSQGDRLVVTGTRRAFMQALARGSARSADDATGAAEPARAPGPDYHVAEAVVTPGSRHAGRTIRNAGIASTHGVDLLGVQRRSRMGRTPLADIRLEPGDTVLVGADEEHLHSMRNSHDLLVLEWSAEAVPQRHKAWLAILIFAAVVFSAASGMLPIVASAIIGAVAMIATGCLTIQQTARAFDKQIYLLVGASIAAATALERTGGAQLLADGAVALLGGQSNLLLLSGFFLLVAVMTNVLSHSATPVLFTPIAVDIARATGVPPEAYVTAVILAANASFATPVGHQTNMLVMGPGGYRFADFMRAGGPLVLIAWLAFTAVAPWYYNL